MNPQPGTVYLVGTGPGAPDLITLRGLNLIKQSDVILHDRLIPTELLNHARPDAIITNIGKTPNQPSPTQGDINALILEHAHANRSVVRLKGGDPFVFGRGGEEMLACQTANIPCIIVPGVTSAIAAPASINVPVTHRQIARSFTVITATTRDGQLDENLDFTALAKIDTLIILMGTHNLAEITTRLITAGRNPQTPAACIASATTLHQRHVIATLETIATAVDNANIHPPAVTIISPTVTLPDHHAP